MNNANALFTNATSPFDHDSSPNFLDPSAAFDSITPSNLDLSQFQTPQSQQQRTGDGVARNHTPGFQHPTYQVNPSIPAKRSHPSEDAVGASPRSAQGNPNASRSQTPQQGPFPHAFPGQHGGQQFQPPTPYQHLQNPSSNHASPSPTMQNQPYRPPGSQPPRMQNQSPQGLPGNNSNFGPQQQIQNNMSRMTTPHDMSNQQFAQNFNPGAMGNPGIMTPNTQGQMQGPHPSAQSSAAQYQEAQRWYQMQLQQNLQNQSSGPNSFARPPSTAGEQNVVNWQQQQRQNGQVATPSSGPSRMINQQALSGQGQSPLQQANMSRLEQSFQNNLNKFVSDNGLTLDPDPRILGTPINWYKLFMAVVKLQPMNPPATQKGNWAMVARFLGVDINQPNASQETETMFDQNLGAFYRNYMNNMKRREQAGQLGAQMQGSPNPMSQTAVKPPQHPLSQADSNQQSRPGITMGMSPASPEQNNVNRTGANGLATPQQSGGQQPGTSTAHGMTAHQQMSSNQAAQQEPRQPNQLFSQTPSRPISQQSETAKSTSMAQREQTTGAPPTEVKQTTEYIPSSKPLKDSYGGYRVDAHTEHGLQHTTQNMINLRLAIATQDLRVVDMLSVTKMLQSGFVHETSAALDQLTLLLSREEQSQPPQQRLDPGHCEELLDALVDCAEVQLDLLSENAPIVSEKASMQSFESLSKLALSDDNVIKARHHISDMEYDLDHTAERVLAISGILRNISANHMDLEGRRVPCASPTVISFLCSALRSLGTHKLLLRTARNTVDFMKDVIIFLSNTALGISLSSEDEAQTILQFLVAFSPMQPLEADSKAPLRFVPYHPARHQYVPSAIDALAKLLARDQPQQPNRAYMKAAFLADTTPRPGDLLTRTFALAICPIPDSSRFPPEAFTMMSHGSRAPMKRDPGILILADRRKAFFSQGMLAADILASLVPASENGPARSWLESEDGWAPNLLRLALRLTDEQAAFYNSRDATEEIIQEQGHRDFSMIIVQALSMLQRLVEKVEVDDEGARLGTNGWPRLDDMMAELLGNNRIHPRVLKQLGTLSRLLR